MFSHGVYLLGDTKGGSRLKGREELTNMSAYLIFIIKYYNLGWKFRFVLWN